MGLRIHFGLVWVIILGLLGCTSKKSDTSILLYCAAGIKPVVEKVAQEYYKQYGVRVDLQYGGSGTLLSNLRVAKQGDLYIAGDRSYIDEAINFGLVQETQALAHMQPVIAVAKGNPKGISKIEDLFNKNIKVAIANPDAASIGRLTKKIFTGLGHWDSLQSNLLVQMPTVNEVANTLKLGTADVGIIWDATANQYGEIDIIENEEFSKYDKSITIGVLKSSQQPTEALKFMRYLSASDMGLIAFKDMGYRPIEGDLWDENPRLLFYSGGVNRVAVDQTINAFEQREGVKVDRVYNGCGILVSQIKAGQRPDAYLSCDVSFMTQVETKFTDITDISNTKIVIATKKGNPKKIGNLKDLTQKDLQLGVCNHDQSALGALTKKLLESQGLWEDVYKNVRSQTPTADLLVNQIRTGSLDAVVVYEANIAQVRDKLDMVELTEKEASALQNFGISVNSNHQYLLKRLLKSITSTASREQYLKNGFHWEFDKI
ncbi:molybdate ABC transporter substrate-binding protein [Arenibacter sp. N53]|uniref:molybdate ABC transporter substrate-binding protein n=1 Tax=Arenibacter TaxID=178469 RepID=UPI000CD3C633|nr:MULTISPECIES: molybdate ABC transporter substrate-binding protein [Arenibacter]MCM4151038.1 molybdate ABC transporter substrate-binding protein [Arenibacter sp. N53]